MQCVWQRSLGYDPTSYAQALLTYRIIHRIGGLLYVQWDECYMVHRIDMYHSDSIVAIGHNLLKS